MNFKCVCCGFFSLFPFFPFFSLLTFVLMFNRVVFGIFGDVFGLFLCLLRRSHFSSNSFQTMSTAAVVPHYRVCRKMVYRPDVEGMYLHFGSCFFFNQDSIGGTSCRRRLCGKIPENSRA
jgi:hypothetical protein